jgi:hypothetical protein
MLVIGATNVRSPTLGADSYLAERGALGDTQRTIRCLGRCRRLLRVRGDASRYAIASRSAAERASPHASGSRPGSCDSVAGPVVVPPATTGYFAVGILPSTPRT